MESSLGDSKPHDRGMSKTFRRSLLDAKIVFGSSHSFGMRESCSALLRFDMDSQVVAMMDKGLFVFISNRCLFLFNVYLYVCHYLHTVCGV